MIEFFRDQKYIWEINNVTSECVISLKWNLTLQSWVSGNYRMRPDFSSVYWLYHKYIFVYEGLTKLLSILERDTVKKMVNDPMFKLDHDQGDKKNIKKALPGLGIIEQLQSGKKDDYILNKLARRHFRVCIHQNNVLTSIVLMTQLNSRSSSLLERLVPLWEMTFGRWPLTLSALIKYAPIIMLSSYRGLSAIFSCTCFHAWVPQMLCRFVYPCPLTVQSTKAYVYMLYARRYVDPRRLACIIVTLPWMCYWTTTVC